MEISNITLKNQHYRYSIYPNPNTEQWGVFLLGNLQEIESVDFFSQSFSETLNVLTVELPGTGDDITPASKIYHTRPSQVFKKLN